MPNKQIKNIVIYKSLESGKEIIKSCIFYTDGTVYEGSYNDGITACTTVAKERNITSKDAMREMMNKEIFHVMTEKEFKKRFESFKGQLSTNDIDNIVQEKIKENSKQSYFEDVLDDVKEKRDKEKHSTSPFYIDIDEEPYEQVVYEEEINNSHYEDFTASNKEEKEEIIEDDYEDNFANRAGEKLTKDHLGVKIGALALGLVVGVGLFAHCTRKSKAGDMVDSNLPTPTPIVTTIDEDGQEELEEVVIRDNDLYDDYTLSQLLEVTDNETQRNAMINASAILNSFNGTFASAFDEAGNDIRPALTFDEVVALQQAYNNYSVDEVRAYFNGYEVDAIEMSNNYKSASLQLMGAYILEDNENHIDMSVLIDSEEGRDFYNRYHELFLAAKEATGEEKLALVRQFYQMVREDFPITEEIRTEGISHADAHNSIEDYQLSVTPMIAAAEMIFRNIDVNDRITNTEYDFLNDIGLCNHADDKFERLETIMLTAYEDNTNPLFTQYRNAIINDLMTRGQYVIDDAHRELANLRRFQIIVNGEENNRLGSYSTTYTNGNGSYSQTTATTTSTETNEWEETTTSTWTETTITNGEIPDSERAAIDDAINQENEEARESAEQAANEEAARQQEIEDENARRIQEEIEQEEQQLQEDIDNANDRINQNNSDTDPSNNTPVNESDFAGNVDFDDNHSDSNGNLDNSVENITTDGSGADQTLPDPNDTAEEFSMRVPEVQYTTQYIISFEDDGIEEIPTIEETNTVEETTGYTEWVEVSEGSAYIEYTDNYIPFDEDGNPIVVEDGGYQYTR